MIRKSLLVLAVAACSSWIAGVPKPLRGNTPVRLTNWTDTPACKFALTPTGQPVNREEDWLGKLGKLKPGETRLYNMKPGDYTIVVRGCDDKYNVEQPIRVDRALAVAIGDPQERPMPGYALLRARAIGRYGRYVPPPAYSGGGGGGEPSGGGESGEAPPEGGGETAAAPAGKSCKPNGAPADFDSECCSGYTEAHGTLHNGGNKFCCGPSFQDCHNTNE